MLYFNGYIRDFNSRLCLRSRCSEKVGCMLLLQYIEQTPYLAPLCGRVKRVWADGGYGGEELINWVKELWGWRGRSF